MKKLLLPLIAMLLILSACAEYSRKEAASIADYEAETVTEEAAPSGQAVTEDWFAGKAMEQRQTASRKSTGNLSRSDQAEIMDESSEDAGGMNNFDFTQVFSSLAAKNTTYYDSLWQLIRTANIQFKVNNVVKATLTIEEIVRQSGGYVEDTKLESKIFYTQNKQIAKDTLLEISCSRVTNKFILRIPSNKLDAALIEMVPLIEQLDFRNINANDVSLNILSKRMEQARMARYGKRMENAIDNRGRKLNDVTNAEQSLLYSMQQADEAKLADLRLQKDITLSTVHLTIYQNESINHVKRHIPSDIKEYEPSFGYKLLNALKSGLNVFLNIIIFIIEVWWLWVLLGALFIVYRKFIRKK